MNEKPQANQFDKIVKENLDAVVPTLIQKVLGIEPIESEDLPADVQYTKERKPDALKRIVDQGGLEYILHIEFQVADDLTMSKRMLLYWAMLYNKYGLPVRQYVFFMGDKAPTMTNQLTFPNLTLMFDLIPFRSLPMDWFVNSARPEDAILAILTDFGNLSAEQATERIIRRIDETAGSALRFNKYITQLRILAKLRKLQPKIDRYMDSIAHLIREEEDVLFIRGERKAKTAFVRKLLSQSDWSVGQIAEVAEVSVAFVEQVQRELNG